MANSNRYRVFFRGKVWGEFDWFSEAWVYVALYLPRLCRIEDMVTREGWVIVPGLVR